MSIGKRISELRKKQGLTQEQLAELLGTTRQAVSKWESGKSNPDLDYVIRMGTIFHITMDDLLLGPESAAGHEEACNIEVTRKSAACGRNRIIFYALLTIGFLILLLCPLFATMYRNYISEYGPAATDPYIYLQKWPLLGVKIAGILSTAIGMIGLAFPVLRKLWMDTAAVWKAQ